MADQFADAFGIVIAIETWAGAGRSGGSRRPLPCTDTNRSGEALTTLPASVRKIPANGAGLWPRRRWNRAGGSSDASKRAVQPRERFTWKTSPATRYSSTR
jgi:hypothetical protein